MASFVLLPGAGGAAWYWHRVAPLLEAEGHTAVAVDFPGDDESAGLTEYAGLALQAMKPYRDVILVAQSMGGFTAPLVCEKAEVKALVLLNAMIPVPGETAGEWFDHTGAEAARQEAAARGGYPAKFDLETYFLHDVPPEVSAAGEAHQRPEVKAAFAEPCRFAAWPDVPIHLVVGKDDRFFPADFQSRIARERLGAAVVHTVPGGHLAALSNPEPLARRLIAVAVELH